MSSEERLANGSLRYTPAEARAMIRDIQRVERVALGEKLIAIYNVFERRGNLGDGISAATWRSAAALVLGALPVEVEWPGVASGDDPPDASHRLYPASVSPAADIMPDPIDVVRLRQAWLNHRAAYFRGPGTLIWHTCWDGCSEELAAEYADPRSGLSS